MVRINGTDLDIGNIVPQPVSVLATKIISQRITWRGLMHDNPWIVPALVDFLVRTRDRYPLSMVVSHSVRSRTSTRPSPWPSGRARAGHRAHIDWRFAFDGSHSV